MIIETWTPEDTFQLGKELGERAKAGDVYTLDGVVNEDGELLETYEGDSLSADRRKNAALYKNLFVQCLQEAFPDIDQHLSGR